MGKQINPQKKLPWFLFQPEDTSGCQRIRKMPCTGDAELTGEDYWHETLKSTLWIGLSICLAMMLAQFN